jgi:hypothetical protein
MSAPLAAHFIDLTDGQALQSSLVDEKTASIFRGDALLHQPQLASYQRMLAVYGLRRMPDSTVVKPAAPGRAQARVTCPRVAQGPVHHVLAPEFGAGGAVGRYACTPCVRLPACEPPNRTFSSTRSRGRSNRPLKSRFPSARAMKGTYRRASLRLPSPGELRFDCLESMSLDSPDSLQRTSWRGSSTAC